MCRKRTLRFYIRNGGRFGESFWHLVFQLLHSPVREIGEMLDYLVEAQGVGAVGSVVSEEFGMVGDGEEGGIGVDARSPKTVGAPRGVKIGKLAAGFALVHAPVLGVENVLHQVDVRNG